MIINDLELNNFGSYEGINHFNFNTDSYKNIVLIGGKNGAGKTTLFTAIRLCIYGYKAFGYQSINSYYNKAIIKLINNSAKLLERISSYVNLDLSINNGRDFDKYTIKREWLLEKNNIEEKYIIYKNHILLDEEEKNDFEKYIMQIIPPDLFDLYFFDGEKIADFFLEEGNKIRLKNAFLTLSGYDTFDIMDRNFKRILSGSSKDNDTIQTFLNLHNQVNDEMSKIDELKKQMLENNDSIENVDSEIRQLDDIYKKDGGISKKEWDRKFQAIKEEEAFRENSNAQLKKIANDILPFLILKNELVSLYQRIMDEIDLKKYQAFLEILQEKKIIELFKEKFSSINNNINSILKKISTDIRNSYFNKNLLLDISSNQGGMLQYQIKKIMDYNQEDIYRYIDAIKKSLNKSKKIREEIEKSSIDKIDSYANKKAKLLDEKAKLLNLSTILSNNIRELESNYAILLGDYNRSKKNYENELKKNSINDISARAVLLLGSLRDELYNEQIKKIENQFQCEINKLMRKDDFISSIKIDNNFNISVYKRIKYSFKQIKEIIKNIGMDGIATTLGSEAYNVIKGLEDLDDGRKSVCIDVELDKSSFSNGEKQIFIMALYKSLMSLCNNEVPFIIDTPFARIDTQHRNNISKYFFRELKGQVFILSTNEEIENKQLMMLKDKLAMTYMLENQDNNKTIISKNNYFEEA